MSINRLLVRWTGGWMMVDRTVAGRTREALLGLGAANSTSEVITVANGQLDIYANQREQISAGIEPAGGTFNDDPYYQWKVGDTVTVAGTQERVRSMTVAVDDNGHVSFAPDFKDVILNAQERWEQALKKMTAGTVRGDSKVATPVGSITAYLPPVPEYGGGET